MEMTAVDPTLASKCLELYQVLVGQKQPFTFSLTVGSSFTFSLDTRGKEEPPSPLAWKKPSPSTTRRNARRQAEFLQRKTDIASKMTADKPEAVGSWRSEMVTTSDKKSVKLKLNKEPPEKIPQLDGLEEETTKDAEVQTNMKAETKNVAVQTNKSATDLGFSEVDQINIPGLTDLPIQVNMGPHRQQKPSMGPYRAPPTNLEPCMGPYPTKRAPKTNMGPYPSSTTKGPNRAPTTNMGPYRTPHSRGGS